MCSSSSNSWNGSFAGVHCAPHHPVKKTQSLGKPLHPQQRHLRIFVVFHDLDEETLQNLGRHGNTVFPQHARDVSLPSQLPVRVLRVPPTTRQGLRCVPWTRDTTGRSCDELPRFGRSRVHCCRTPVRCRLSSACSRILRSTRSTSESNFQKTQSRSSATLCSISSSLRVSCRKSQVFRVLTFDLCISDHAH